MLSGTSPFVGDDYGDTAAISKNILENALEFPGEWESEMDKEDCTAAKVLCSALLERDLASRLGCLKGGVADIQKQDWFSGGGNDGSGNSAKATDWEAMYRREAAAPWVPTGQGKHHSNTKVIKARAVHAAACGLQPTPSAIAR